MALCGGRVAIVTGAGRGIGREHALMLAGHGAAVVVNDVGGSPEGTGNDATPAEQVVAEIEAMGGRAVANADDVADWDGAAKMGIAGFTIIAALELARYGITVNAISPGALTRLTEALRAEPPSEAEREAQSPRWIAPICTWLASPLSRNVTGRVFQVHGQEIAIAESWHRGPTTENVEDPEAMTDVVARLVAEARPNADMHGDDAEGPGRPGRTI